MVYELRGLTYYERLKKLGITDLDSRRKRGDLIQVYKIINELEEIGDIDLRIGKVNIGRKHTHQIIRELCKANNPRYRFLTNRTATTWNMLPANVVETRTVNSFKAALDSHMAAGRLRRSVYQP